MMTPDLEKITVTLRSLSFGSGTGGTSEITQGISIGLSVPPLSHHELLQVGQTSHLSHLSHQRTESDGTAQAFDTASVVRCVPPVPPVPPYLTGPQTSNALFSGSDAPAPLTQRYPCVVCGQNVRWDDHGVWRCQGCWPEPMTRATRQAEALERTRVQAATRPRVHSKPRDPHLGPICGLTEFVADRRLIIWR